MGAIILVRRSTTIRITVIGNGSHYCGYCILNDVGDATMSPSTLVALKISDTSLFAMCLLEIRQPSDRT